LVVLIRHGVGRQPDEEEYGQTILLVAIIAVQCPEIFSYLNNL